MGAFVGRIIINRKYILIYIEQDAKLHTLFYLESALHVSDGTTIHHQERKQDMINSVTLHFGAYVLEYTYDARTHEG
jgi:hypothetical protein